MEKKNKNQANLLAKECMVIALLQLLEVKPLSAITVSEITKKAGVSRMTYYRNYINKEDIFSSFLDDLLYNYHEEFNNLPEKGNFYDLHNLNHCFLYFEKHKTLIQALFKNGHGNIFLTSLSDYIIHKWYKESDDITRYYTLLAFAGSIFNVFVSWSLNDTTQSPEQMASIIYDIYHR
ncbi:TetR/AcrR family transcriptional regulator [Niameybacter massiliensis]|uniref:TetR/AcrR family transcriptional regulator n=1 Tax=Holtiella tumoricola TaxID=3018743 RepID=A0AA42DQK3_9FIRM|nr:TetR/AcrR family transcriptional regulator [Holtiella tumoricola]MDA3733514.1 TetR/AcrR family transcriptional regulator [Holtiella tumoricola]